MLNALIRQSKNATKYSLEGFKYLFMSEFAARIEVYCFFWVFAALIVFKVPAVFLLSTLGLFLALLAIEALNTAIEVIVDKVSPEISEMGKQAKDLGSFAVMCLLIINIAHFIYVLTKIDWSSLDINISIIASLLALVIGLYLAVHRQPRKRAIFIITPVLLLYFLGLGVYLASNSFTGAGFDNKVIYHLKTGLGGAGFGEYTGLILWMSAYALGGLFLTYLINDLIGKKKRGLSRKLTDFVHRTVDFRTNNEPLSETPKVATRLNKNWLSAAAIVLALILNPLTGNLFNLLNRPAPEIVEMSDFELYVHRDLGTLNDKLTNKKNLLFVYLEGLERTYFNEDVFPGLAPNLAALEAKSLSFSDIRQVFNTEWTIAGMVATQCGVPMFTPAQGNTMNAYDQFMPNAVCLGDILDGNGYQVEFLGGGDLDFAGKGKFLQSHGFDETTGRDDHEKESFSEDQYNGWGLYDDALLDVAFEDFTELSKQKDPFSLFILTLDTHQPRGHVSKSCEGRQYQDGSNPLLNAVYCADRLVTDFVAKVRATPYADDTLIIIVSDHVSMNGTASKLLETAPRRNLFMIIDPTATSPKIVERPGSPLDVTPTILSLLGVENTAIGFGRNLLGLEKTLIEEKPEHFNFFLWQIGKTIKSELWNFPRLSKGMTLDAKNERLNIGRRWLSIPTVLTLDAENEISGLEFYSIDLGEREGYLAKKLPKTASFLWIDNCIVMQPSLPTMSQSSYEEGQWCATVGNKKDQLFETVELDHRDKIFPEKFKPLPQTQ